MKRFVFPIVMLVVAAAVVGSAVQAQQASPAFTAAQADHGAQLYSDNCASCHGPNLDDGAFAPALKGANFRRDWGGKSVSALQAFLSAQMPPGQSGALSSDDYTDVIAYLLQSGGAAAGSKPLAPALGAGGAQMLPK